MNVVELSLMLFGVAWSGIFGLAHAQVKHKAKVAAAWPSVSGQAVATEIVVDDSSSLGNDGTTWYKPVVNYAYTVEGVPYQGTRIRFGNRNYASQKKAEAALAPYRIGSAVAVKYNPDDPHDAVLETGKPNAIYFMLALFGIPFIVIGLAWELFTP